MREAVIQYSKLRRRPAGFTVTEVVMASAVLVIAMVPILKALTTAYVSGAVIKQKSVGLMFAECKLNEIRIRAIYNYGSTFTASDTSLGNSYYYRVQDTANGADLRTITVSTGYDFNGNGSLSADEIRVVLSTLIARRY